MDKVRLGYGIPAVVCTNPDYGFLRYVNGKVEVNTERAFNTARRILHAGGSIFRIMRHAPWHNPARFDIHNPDYRDIIRELTAILHQPYQTPGTGQGADIWFEPFDGCGNVDAPGQTPLDKTWIFTNEAEVRWTIREVFRIFHDRPYVKIGCGNEIGGTLKQCLRFHEILFEEFKAADRVPFSFGATYSTTDDNIEYVKKMAGEKRFWGDFSNKWIFREVHKVGSDGSTHLHDVVKMWGNHPIRHCYSADGVKPRPNITQWRSVLEYVFKNVRTLEIKKPADTKLKIIFELFGEVGGAPELVMLGASETYAEKFRSLPRNCGEYPFDWIPPQPPPPPPAAEIVLMEVCKESRLIPNAYCPEKDMDEFVKGYEPVFFCAEHQAPKPCSYFLKNRNIRHWLRCIFLGRH
jgi:hypothetical protein